jgi:hypothetical protein
MGYLNNDSVTVDAILTKHGRRKLAHGQGLGIAKAAFSDDGIDYTLWNSAHPSGSANFGDAITNLPMLEAVPDDSAVMRYKLMTLPRNTVFMPYIQSIADDSISNLQDSITLTPVTGNGADTSYMFRFTDFSAINVTGGTAIDTAGSTQQYLSQVEIPYSHTRVGSSITISAKTTNVTRTVTVMITGTSTGAVTSVDITLNPNTYVQQS